MVLMQRRCLDIDNSDEWMPIYEPFFARLAPPEVWSHLLNPEEFGSAEARIRAIARLLAPPRRWKYHWLRNQLREFLAANFTHVALYHACRIVSAESYLAHGLLPSDIAKLDREAVALFGPSDALSNSIRAARNSGYRAHNEGGVYVFYARSGAIYLGDHYLSHGSEYLGRIAGDLGTDQLAILEQRGRPALVRCELALANVALPHVRYASMLPLHHRLIVRESPVPPGLYALPGGFKYPRAIPAVQVAIEYLDVCVG